ncbi:MAG: type II toxin-antitoxin system VapB family antitoxin [Cyanobacteriota bacterium]|nr:type II toxin-antitoxin system VapB family antitoxin [Cyanobacteriota bacterium]
MNIKDPVVHAMARELAQRRSTSVTDAVRQALRAELERCPNHGTT